MSKINSIVDLVLLIETGIQSSAINGHVVQLASKNKHDKNEMKKALFILNNKKYWEIRDGVSNCGFLPGVEGLLFLQKEISVQVLIKRVLIDYLDTLVGDSEYMKNGLFALLNNKLIDEVILFIHFHLPSLNNNPSVLSYLEKSINKPINSTLLKKQLWILLNENPKLYADYFVSTLLKTKNPFEILGGATFEEIGQYVKKTNNDKFFMFLLKKLEYSKDPWFDVQQIGRWVQYDFIDRNSELPIEKEMSAVLERLEDYCNAKFRILP